MPGNNTLTSQRKWCVYVFIAEEKKGRRFDLMHVYSQDDYINAAADQLVLA